jgi:hypothetical protein
MEQELTNFLKVVTLSQTIEAGTKEAIDLSAVQKNFGRNFNTLSIINTSTKPITLYLDGEAAMYIVANNGVFKFDHEDGIYFSLIEIENEDGSNNLDSSEIKLTIGRTG